MLRSTIIPSGKRHYYLRKTGAKRRGYYLELWAYLEGEWPKLFLGHEKSFQYGRGQFLILPPSENFNEYIVATQSLIHRQRIINAFKNSADLRRICESLFDREFCQVTISREIHIGFPALFYKKTVLRYFPLKPDDRPQDVCQKLDLLLEMIK